jgi:hypothetical protein
MTIDFTQSFEEFATKTGPMDLVLYAGVALVVWILFKDNLTSVLSPLVSGLKDLVSKKTSEVSVPQIDPVVMPKVVATAEKDETFFKLIVSWKQTRDLAEKSGCVEAIKVADQMFPYLSPTVCGKKEEVK